jgi:hypothetical protein
MEGGRDGSTSCSRGMIGKKQITKKKKKMGKPNETPSGKQKCCSQWFVVLFGDVIGFWVRLSLGCFRFESPMVAE